MSDAPNLLQTQWLQRQQQVVSVEHWWDLHQLSVSVVLDMWEKMVDKKSAHGWTQQDAKEFMQAFASFAASPPNVLKTDVLWGEMMSAALLKGDTVLRCGLLDFAAQHASEYPVVWQKDDFVQENKLAYYLVSFVEYDEETPEQTAQLLAALINCCKKIAARHPKIVQAVVDAACCEERASPFFLSDCWHSLVPQLSSDLLQDNACWTEEQTQWVFHVLMLAKGNHTVALRAIAEHDPMQLVCCVVGLAKWNMGLFHRMEKEEDIFSLLMQYIPASHHATIAQSLATIATQKPMSLSIRSVIDQHSISESLANLASMNAVPPALRKKM